MKHKTPIRATLQLCLLCLLLLTAACNQEVPYLEELRGIADQVNRKCPQMLDSETRLDGILVSEPNTITYNYTLVHINVTDVDTHEFNRAVWPGLLSNIKVTSEMKKMRDNQTTVHYTYFDKAQKPICTITITPQHYK